MSRNDFLSPEEMYGELFYEVHRRGIFEDGKMFADAKAKLHPDIIVKTYLKEKDQVDFNLDTFITEYFDVPTINSNGHAKLERPIDDHLNHLWQELERPADDIKKNRSSKIPLPYPYIVPGGRFNEMYYWDSYFTMLGLNASGKNDLIHSMVNNFKHQINTIGFIPNGNRSYFLSRSQPPFYSLMVKLLVKAKGQELIPDYLSSLVAEYNFWMHGLKDIKEENTPLLRVIKIGGNKLLNRYYDNKDTPREEMFRDDWSLIDFDTEIHNDLFRQLRAACESGWDFSSRWLKDPQDLKTIQTTDLLPIDLNCLLWHLEKLISECYGKIGNQELSLNYGIIAHNRKKAIQDLFWSKGLVNGKGINGQGFFSDYNWKTKMTTDRLSLAGIYPLFFKLCTEEQASQCAEVLKEKFLKEGGLVTTPYDTGQQWDAPNGWAPLQWIAIKGLINYGYKTLAQEIALRWTSLNKSVYLRTGKMLEKYNVEDISLEGGGGEYPVQDGFGWTNGVYLGLVNL